MIILSKRRGNFKHLDLQEHPPAPQSPCLLGYLDLPMRKTLRVVGLLAVIIFFQSKTLTAGKIKDEKEKKIFYFSMVFNLLKIATHKNIWYVTNSFKYKFFSVITQLGVTVTLLYFS